MGAWGTYLNSTVPSSAISNPSYLHLTLHLSAPLHLAQSPAITLITQWRPGGPRGFSYFFSLPSKFSRNTCTSNSGDMSLHPCLYPSSSFCHVFHDTQNPKVFSHCCPTLSWQEYCFSLKESASEFSCSYVGYRQLLLWRLEHLGRESFSHLLLCPNIPTAPWWSPMGKNGWEQALFGANVPLVILHHHASPH